MKAYFSRTLIVEPGIRAVIIDEGQSLGEVGPESERLAVELSKQTGCDVRLTPMFDLTLAAPLPARLGLAVASLTPLGIAMGVPFPSDVVAGWSGGAAWAFTAAALLYEPAKRAADSAAAHGLDPLGHR